MKKLNYLLIILIIITIITIKKVYSKDEKIELTNPTIIKNEIKFMLKSKENTYINSIEIFIKDNEDNIIYKALIPINQTIKDKLEIKHKSNYDLSNSSKIDFTIK